MDIELKIKNHIKKLFLNNPMVDLSVNVFRAMRSKNWIVYKARPGRWHKNSCAVYASCQYDGAMAEVWFYDNLNSKNGKLDDIQKIICPPVFEFEVVVNSALRITLEDLIELEHDIADFVAEKRLEMPSHNLCCQKVGEAAAELGVAALFVPSARWECENLVLFLENFNSQDCIVCKDVVKHQDHEFLLYEWAKSRGIQYS